MKAAILLVLLFGLCSVSSVQLGYCKFQPTSAFGAPLNIAGYINFLYDEVAQLVNVSVNVTGGFTDAQSYAIHVHIFGDVSDPVNATAAGSHYVGLGSTNHGCPPNTVRHEGDMGNWQANGNAINLLKTFDLLTLTGGYSIVGHAVIIHTGSDNCSNPTGFSGNRYAQCVIGIANTANNTAVNTAAATTIPTGICNLQSVNSNCSACTGTVYITQLTDQSSNNVGLAITAKVTGLSTSTPHGFHIHTYGDLSSGDGTSAGPHWNPNNNSHDLPPNTPRHAGDLGNIQSFDTNGDAWYYVSNYTYITDLNSIIGRAFVVHSSFDHGAGNGCDQSGTSGVRYLACVIGAANNNTVIPSVPQTVTINNTYVEIACSVPSNSPIPAGSSSSESSSVGDGGDGGSGSHITPLTFVNLLNMLF